MDKRMKKAQRAHGAGDLGEACLLYRKVAKDWPQDVDAWYLLGTAEAERGHLKAALEAFSRAEALAPSSARIQNNLGNVLFLRGDQAGACDRYQRAATQDPTLVQARFNLGRTLKTLGQASEAEGHLRAALALDPGFLEARYILGILRQECGDEAEAKVLLAQVAQAAGSPRAEEARHRLDALEGRNPAQPPVTYVRELFEGFAPTFEQDLVDRLGYSAPQLAVALLERLRPGPEGLGSGLDLGCGTGLSGMAVRPWTERLVGVDLSPRMLEVARAKGCYMDLIEGDAVACLAGRAEGSVGLVVALDVLIYLGDPAPLLTAAARALRPGGLLILTLETREEAADVGFRLLPSGRYGHHQEVLRDLAAPRGLHLAAAEAIPLRQEAGAWIPGALLAFERRD